MKVVLYHEMLARLAASEWTPLKPSKKKSVFLFEYFKMVLGYIVRML